MRPQKVLDIEILTSLTKVFRAKGYEGASLKDLSDATGLKKASLYHRFPNGKKEMAEAVLNHIDVWVKAHIFEALNNTENTAEVRLKNALMEIRNLYDKGNETCVLRALSMQSSLELFGSHIESAMTEWITVFTKFGTDINLTPEIAKAKAIQTLIEIQGSLIVCKGLNNIALFENTLKHIENNYLKH